MEVTIEKPGHYVFESKNGLDVEVLKPEVLSGCQLSDIPTVISKRLFDPKESVLIIKDGSKATLILNRNPTPSVFTTTVEAATFRSKPLEFLQINKSGWAPADLAKVLRFNPHLFMYRHDAMNLASLLTNMVYSKKKSLENQQDTRGNKNSNVEITTVTNLPESIMAFVPLLNSTDPIELKLLIELNPHDDLIYFTNLELNSMLDAETVKEIQNIVEFCNGQDIPVVNC